MFGAADFDYKMNFDKTLAKQRGCIPHYTH